MNTVDLPFCWSWPGCSDIFFDKEGAAEKEGVDFDIGDQGTSAHLHWVEEPVYFFIVFWLQKRITRFWKLSWLMLSSLDYWNILICLETVQNQGKGKG